MSHPELKLWCASTAGVVSFTLSPASCISIIIKPGPWTPSRACSYVFLFRMTHIYVCPFFVSPSLPPFLSTGPEGAPISRGTCPSFRHVVPLIERIPPEPGNSQPTLVLLTSFLTPPHSSNFLPYSEYLPTWPGYLPSCSAALRAFWGLVSSSLTSNPNTPTSSIFSEGSRSSTPRGFPVDNFLLLPSIQCLELRLECSL
jgi:hypothetical protein